MANPVDILIQRKALDDLDLLVVKIEKAQKEILKLASDALIASRNLSNITMPTDLATLTTNTQSLTAQINAQSVALADLQRRYDALNSQRQTSSNRTAEESVNQSLLNRNARQSAIINSELAGAYGRLSASQSQASRNLQDLVVRGRLSTQTQRQYNTELRLAQREFTSLNTRVLAADRAVGRFNRNVGNYPKLAGGIGDLMGAFGVVGGVTLFAQITKDIFQQAKELQSLDLALKQVTDSQEEFGKAQEFISRVSEQYGVGIKELTKSYTQFYVSAKDKLSGVEIQGIFESISKAAGAMGLSVDQQQGAFLALTQMLSKGAIQAEELRGQLSERLPGSFGILAKSMGVTEAVLGDMLKKGEVMAADVLPKFAKELEKAYGIENLHRVESLTAETTRLSNSWTNLIREFTEGDSAVSAFFITLVSGLKGALEGLNNLAKSNKELSADVFKTTEAKAYANELQHIADSAEETGQSQEDWANSTKNNVLPAIQSLTVAIAQNERTVELSQKRWSDYLSPQSWKNFLRATDQLKKQNEELGRLQGRLRAANEILNPEAEKPETVIAKTDAQLEKEKKALEKQANLRYITRKKELELELQVIDRTLDNDEVFYQDRLRALELHRLKRLEIISLQYNEERRVAKGNNELQKQALLDYHSSVLTEIDRFNSKEKSIKGLQTAGLIKTEQDINKTLQESADKAIKRLKAEEAAAQSLRDEMELLQKATDEYIKSFSDSYLGSIGLGSLDKFFDGTFDKLMKGADTMQEKFAVTFLAITEVAKEAFAFINQASQANFEAEYSRLELQKEVAIKFAGESTTAQEAVNEEYERRRKAIQRREAESKKDLAIFNSIVNTAQGVTSALASANIPLAITIGILGAIQTGFIASQEIPQFFDGGTHKGGLMMVNDGKGSNYKETVVTPDGKVINPTSRNVLMDAPKGTQIFNASQTKERDAYLQSFLQEKGISMNFQPRQSGLSETTFLNGISRLERTMSNSSGSSISADKRGISLWKTEQNKRIKVLNNRLYVRK